MKKNKNLRNLISLKKYSDLKDSEQYDFLLKNAIYTKRNKEVITQEHLKYQEKKATWILEKYYILNPIITTTIISLFFEGNFDSSPIKDKIKVDIANSLDVSETLKKWHKKYNTTITESYIIPLDFYEDNKINKKKLKTYITKHFKSSTCGCIHFQNIVHYISTEEFDLYCIKFYEELIKVIISMDILHFLKEQTNKNTEEKSKTNSKQLTIRQAVMLIEEIQRIEDWSECDATKKAVVISRLIGRHENNIRKVYSEFGKNPSKLKPQFEKDTQLVSNLLKSSKLI